MSQDKIIEIRKKINLMGRGLILMWNAWNKDTAEHAQARDKAIDDFTADIYSLVTDCKGCREKDKEIVARDKHILELHKCIALLQKQITEARGRVAELEGNEKFLISIVEDMRNEDKLHGQITDASAKYLHFKQGMCGLCPEKDEQIASLQQELKGTREASWDVLRQNRELWMKIAELSSMVDGASIVVELFKATSPAQIEWKKKWLEKFYRLKEEK